MTRLLFLLPILSVGCGGSGVPESKTVSVEPAEAPEVEACSRAHLPVEPCEGAVHPELIGLWGHGSAPSLWPVFVYDGCYVTLSFTCPYAGDDLRLTLEEMRQAATFAGEAAERAARGIPEHEHHGRVHRTHALWRDGALFSVSEVSIDIELARILQEEDGSPRLGQPTAGGRIALLTRYPDDVPLNDAARPLLCPPPVVRRPDEWRQMAVEAPDGEETPASAPARASKNE